MPCQSSSQVPGCPKCVAWKWPPSSCSHQVLLLQPLYTWSGSLQQDILIDTHLSRCVFAGSFSTWAVQQMGSTKQWGKTNCCCWRQHERVARKRTNTTNSDATRLQNDSMFYIMLLKSVNHHTPLVCLYSINVLGSIMFNQDHQLGRHLPVGSSSCSTAVVTASRKLSGKWNLSWNDCYISKMMETKSSCLESLSTHYRWRTRHVISRPATRSCSQRATRRFFLFGFSTWPHDVHLPSGNWPWRLGQSPSCKWNITIVSRVGKSQQMSGDHLRYWSELGLTGQTYELQKAKDSWIKKINKYKAAL